MLEEGGQGEAIAPPPQDFETSVNPIQTRGADYVHHITNSPPPHTHPIFGRFGVSGCPRYCFGFPHTDQDSTKNAQRFFFEDNHRAHETNQSDASKKNFKILGRRPHPNGLVSSHFHHSLSGVDLVYTTVFEVSKFKTAVTYTNSFISL